MKYLLQIYPVRASEEFERLPADEQQAIVDEYLAIGQSPGADLDAVLKLAARIPAARMGGTVEVRPLVQR